VISVANAADTGREVRARVTRWGAGAGFADSIFLQAA
jgi:hypothetical protein